MLKNFIYACITYTAIADQLLGARDDQLRELKTCKNTCRAPYTRDAKTCKCTATQVVNPVCKTDYTADTTEDVCECTNVDTALNYGMSCYYGFMLDMTSCQCLGPQKCPSRCEKGKRQNKYDCSCNEPCARIECEKGMRQSDITCTCVGRGVL